MQTVGLPLSSFKSTQETVTAIFGTFYHIDSRGCICDAHLEICQGTCWRPRPD